MRFVQCVIVGMGICLSAGAGQEAVLAEGGETDWHISVSPTASPPERLAGRELSRYLEQITGAAFAVVEEARPTGTCIRLAAEQGRVDGFRVEVAPDRIAISGSTPRGALYGAYDLLERLGCRWHYLGALGETVPRLDRASLPVGSVAQEASFPVRSVFLGYPSYFERFEEWLDLFAKLRINGIAVHGIDWTTYDRDRYLPMIAERGFILEYGGHLMPGLVPRTLFEEHPEYFRMNEEGERVADYNFCPSSDALALMQRNARALFEKAPEIRYWHVWADDLMGGGWCFCPRCEGMSPGDQNALATNALAETLAEASPDAALALLAYHDTGRAPTIAPAPNVFLLHAPRERCYRHAFDDPDCRRNREEYLPDWRALRDMFLAVSPDALHEFSYYSDGILYREMQPPQIDVIPADARFFRAEGLHAHQNLMVAYRDWRSPPFSLVLSSRAAWNADTDGQAELEDFCRAYYGDAVAERMVDYYREVDRACNHLFDGDPIVGPYNDMTWPPLAPEMRAAIIANTQEANAIHAPLLGALDEALTETPDGIYRERLQRERDVCELHGLLLALAACQFEGRYLGFTYASGGLDDAAAQRSLELMDEGIAHAEAIIAWAERFPEEQGSTLGGWRSYYGDYLRVFEDMIALVTEKRAERTAE